MPMTKDFGMLTDSIGADAVITFDYGSGTPEMAAAWAAYCLSNPQSKTAIGTDSKGINWKTTGYWASLRAAAPSPVDDGLNPLRANHPLPYPISRFEVGNECYGSWENDTHATKHDAALYAEFYAKTVALVKFIVPNAQLGAVVTENEDTDGSQQETVINPRTRQQHSGWSAVLLSALYGLKVVPDFVIYHYYAEQPGAEDDADLLQSAKSWRPRTDAIRQMLNDYMHGSAKKTQLICTENNSVTFNPGKQSTSIVNGLFLADTFGAILSTEFKGYYWWNLHNGTSAQFNNSSKLYGWRNYGDYGVLAAGQAEPLTPNDTPYPTFHALEVIGKFAHPGDFPCIAVSDNALVSAYAVKSKGGELSLLVINKSPAKSEEVQISLFGYQPRPTAETWSYGVQQDSAESTGKPGALVHGLAAGVSQSFGESLAPYSMTVFNLKRS